MRERSSTQFPDVFFSLFSPFSPIVGPLLRPGLCFTKVGVAPFSFSPFAVGPATSFFDGARFGTTSWVTADLFRLDCPPLGLRTPIGHRRPARRSGPLFGSLTFPSRQPPAAGHWAKSVLPPAEGAVGLRAHVVCSIPRLT